MLHKPWAAASGHRFHAVRTWITTGTQKISETEKLLNQRNTGSQKLLYKKKKKKKKNTRNKSFSAAMKKKITASNTSPVLVSYWENKTTSARVRDLFHRSISFNRTKKRRIDRGEGVKGGQLPLPQKAHPPVIFYQSGPPTPVQSVNGNTTRHCVKL